MPRPSDDTDEWRGAPRHEAVLRCEHLVKRYGERTVVDGLLGPNGAGTTTTGSRGSTGRQQALTKGEAWSGSPTVERSDGTP